MTVRQYKDFKNLKKENLRDNMSTLELVLNMLAEATVTELTYSTHPKGFEENKKNSTERREHRREYSKRNRERNWKTRH